MFCLVPGRGTTHFCGFLIENETIIDQVSPNDAAAGPRLLHVVDRGPRAWPRTEGNQAVAVQNLRRLRHRPVRTCEDHGNLGPTFANEVRGRFDARNLHRSPPNIGDASCASLAPQHHGNLTRMREGCLRIFDKHHRIVLRGSVQDAEQSLLDWVRHRHDGNQTTSSPRSCTTRCAPWFWSSSAFPLRATPITSPKFPLTPA
jgi:hypothetical protein